MHIESIKLRHGAGNGNPKDGLCLMQAVHWFSGADNLSDHPECASPALCRIGIRLNDTAPNQEARDRLWPLVWQLLDSRDPDAEQARAEHVVREVTHRIVTPVFDRLAPEHAAMLRAAISMSEIGEAAAAARVWATVWAVAARAAAARAAAWAVEAAVWAEAAAEAAAWAAEAAAVAEAQAPSHAAAVAGVAATWAMKAAARAEAAVWAEAAGEAAWAAWAAATGEAWNELRLIFIETIALGRHGEADPIYEPRAAQLLRILELAK